MSSAAHHISNATHSSHGIVHALPEHVQHNIKVGTHDIKQGVHNAHKMVSKAAHTAYKVSKQIAYDIAIGVFILILIILIIVLFSSVFQKTITKKNITVSENLTVSGTFTSANTVNATTTNYDLISCDGITVSGTLTTGGDISTSDGVFTTSASGITTTGGIMGYNIIATNLLETPSLQMNYIVTASEATATMPADTYSSSISQSGLNISIVAPAGGYVYSQNGLILTGTDTGSGTLSCDGITVSDGISCGSYITIGSSTTDVTLSCGGSGTLAVDGQVNAFSVAFLGDSTTVPYLSTNAGNNLILSTGAGNGLQFSTSSGSGTILCTGDNQLTIAGELNCDDIYSTEGITCTNINASNNVSAQSITVMDSTANAVLMQLGSNATDNYATFQYSSSGILLISPVTGTSTSSTTLVTGVVQIAGSLNVGGGDNTCSIYSTAFNSICFGGSATADLYCGDIYSYGAALSSDYRLKEEIEPISDEYSIDKLKPCSYVLKADESKTLQTGFIAHELQEIFPHLVKGEKDAEEMQYVNYIGLIAILTKELQSLKSVVAELKTDNIMLKHKIIELENK